MIGISAVLHLPHNGFESFEGVLTEYDLTTNGLLNICQKSKRKFENNHRYTRIPKICFVNVMASELIARLCLPWAASGSYDKKRGKNVEVLPWHIRKTYLQFSDYPFLQ